MRIKLAYGREGLWVDLPENATVVEPRHVPGLPDERAALSAALHAPIGTPPLEQLARGSASAAIVFSDLTRPMPNDRVLPVLLEELRQGGIPDERVTLINALGTHRAQSAAELRGMLGDAIVDRYRIVQHDAWDDSAMVAIGYANRAGRQVRVNRAYVDASLRVLTGFIEPHFFAGFSGGPKAVLPGIADAESVMDNHNASMIAERQATWAVLGGNPIWEEMLGAARMAAPSFLLNVTVNRSRQITGVFAGDLVEAHRAGADFLRGAAMQPVAEPYDIVITTNSGYPLDLNLYQAVKGMSAAAQIVRPGGHIIAAAECWDGIPAHGEYGRLLREASSPSDLLRRVMAPGFRCQDQWEAQLQAQIQLKAHVHVFAGGLTDEALRAALLDPCRSIEATVASLLAENPAATIAVLPDGPQTVPYVRPAA